MYFLTMGVLEKSIFQLVDQKFTSWVLTKNAADKYFILKVGNLFFAADSAREIRLVFISIGP